MLVARLHPSLCSVILTCVCLYHQRGSCNATRVPGTKRYVLHPMHLPTIGTWLNFARERMPLRAEPQHAARRMHACMHVQTSDTAQRRRWTCRFARNDMSQRPNSLQGTPLYVHTSSSSSSPKGGFGRRFSSYLSCLCAFFCTPAPLAFRGGNACRFRVWDS